MLHYIENLSLKFKAFQLLDKLPKEIKPVVNAILSEFHFCAKLVHKGSM